VIDENLVISMVITIGTTIVLFVQAMEMVYYGTCVVLKSISKLGNDIITNVELNVFMF